MNTQSDYLIIGGGIMGLAVARTLKQRSPDASITLIDKEDDVAYHASGRNSGVLHAGFYYSADSLKARFCREGNAAMREYVAQNNLKINDCKKVVVAQNESELEILYELFRRGQINGVPLQLVDEKQLADIEANAKTTGQAIYATTTAIVDPIEICKTIRAELERAGVVFHFNTPYQRRVSGNAIEAGGKYFEAGRIINCAGLYADRIARDFGFCNDYAIIPFKGVYLKYQGGDIPAQTCIYPVPNLANPFLGVHFSVTVDGTVKIGPTAIPAFWRENYQGMEGFNGKDMLEVLMREAVMMATDSNFRKLAWREIKKYYPPHMAAQAAKMVKHLEIEKFTGWSRPGIRAQLINIRTHKLLHDFVVEGDGHSTHVLNAVSPAFTSSFPFARHIAEEHLN